MTGPGHDPSTYYACEISHTNALSCPPHVSLQVAALNPDGSLFFSSVTGGGGVWSWSSVKVVGAGFATTVPRRVTWAGEGWHVGCATVQM